MTKPDWAAMNSAQKREALYAIVSVHPELSASELAMHFLNCSRNAIIGAAHRSNGKISLAKPKAAIRAKAILEKASAARKLKSERNRVPRSKLATRAALAQATASPHPSDGTAPPDTAIILPAAPDVSHALAFIEASDSVCRWPLWGRFSGAEVSRICGDHTEDGSPYCAFHRHRSTFRKPAEAAA